MYGASSLSARNGSIVLGIVIDETQLTVSKLLSTVRLTTEQAACVLYL